MLYDNVNLHYTADTARNTGTRFHLSMNYKVGYDEIPNLKWAAPLLNNAYSPDNSDIYDFKSKMMKYGGHVHSWCNDGEWYVNILGESEYLDSIMTLVSRLLIAPRFNKDDMISVSRVASHMMQQESNNQYVVSNAAMEKVMYGENSLYIDRPSPESMYSWKFVEGTVVESFLPGTEISKALFDATGYALDIHYSGPIR